MNRRFPNKTTLKISGRVRDVIKAMSVVLVSSTLVACGGDDGEISSGPPAAGLAGQYSGDFTYSLQIAGASERSSFPAFLSMSIDKSGKLVANAANARLTGRLSGNQFRAESKRTLNYAGGVCNGPEAIQGTLTSRVATGSYLWNAGCSDGDGSTFRVTGTGKFRVFRDTGAVATAAPLATGGNGNFQMAFERLLQGK